MGRTFITTLLLFSLRWVDAIPVKLAERQASNSTLQWSSCGQGSPASLQCTTLQVPMNWDDPTGPKITLNMSRVRATNNATRIGSLIFNPGGPGGPAIPFCRAQAAGRKYFSDALTSHFDIVCPDPRGIGASSPIVCDADIWNERISIFPQNEAQYEQMVNKYKAFGESCLNMTGDLVKYVDTASVAKDFEAIRVALGEGKLNYLGTSYGTQIGTQYAELYPENFRAMALDGMLDHSASKTYFLIPESETYESELNRFFAYCSGNTTCALHGQNISAIFDDLVAKADVSPIPAPGCAPTANGTSAGTCFLNVTGEDIRLNTQGLLLSKNRWNNLGTALSQAQNGDATLLSTPIATNSSGDPYWGLVVGCLDWPRYENFADNKYKQQLTNSTSPHTRGAAQSYTYEAQCAGWPVPISNPPHVLNQTQMRKTAPIFMANAYYDPSTSYTWAISVDEQVPNGSLFTRNGDGHTSYFLGGEVTRAIDTYLVDLKLPQQNLVVQP